MVDLAQTSGGPKSFRWAVWLPLALFAAVVILVMIGLLHPASRDIPSRLVGHKLPTFTLPAATDTLAGLSDKDFVGGQPRVLNIFASWCVPCAVETPVMAELAARGWQVDGIAIRDDRADLAAFLARNGNPYTRIGADDVSAVQMAMGSSGVPESFIVDAHGVIRYQHIGVIMPDQMAMIEDKLREATK